MEKLKKIDKLTLIRTIVLFIALINQVLVIVGLSPLPIEDTSIELLVSTSWTIIAAILSWWKNNSFTKEAIQAQEVLSYLRSTSSEDNEQEH